MSTLFKPIGFALTIFCFLMLFGGRADTAPSATEVVESQLQKSTISRKGDVRYTYLGEESIQTGYMFQGTHVGGLSGITYSKISNQYYCISDDRSRLNPARFYTLTIDLSDGRLDQGDVLFTAVTTLTDEKGRSFPVGGIDAEGIAVTSDGSFFIASEGDVKKRIAPFINQFDRDGRETRRLRIADKYAPAKSAGIRNNLAFESLTLTPDERFLYTAVENALFQDGPKADVGQESLSRIAKYDLKTGRIVAEFIYKVEAVAQASMAFLGSRSNGLAELLAVDNDGTFLALERGYTMGVGVTAKLYLVDIRGATNVADIYALGERKSGSEKISPAPVSKSEILNFADLMPWVDNLEAMTFGPLLPDGRRSLIVVSDNNFSDAQKTQFIALALDINGSSRAQ